MVVSGGDKDLIDGSGFFYGDDLVVGYGSLKSVDGVNFSDDDMGIYVVEGYGVIFVDIIEISDNGDFVSNYDVGSMFDIVDERFVVVVEVVEFGFGDRVVDVDGRNKEFFFFEYVVEVVDISGGFFRDIVVVFEYFRVFVVDKGSEVIIVVEDEV